MRSWRFVSVAHTHLYADFCVYGILIFFNIFPGLSNPFAAYLLLSQAFSSTFLFSIHINAARLGSIHADVGLKGRA